VESWQELISRSDTELAKLDPLVMNLLVAKGIPAQADLAVAGYQQQADCWAAEVQRCLPWAEAQFRETPQAWKGDLAFLRLGVLCWYVDEVLGIRYREDQKDLMAVAYTDPADLFLHGVMDSRRGTCANMPTLHVALAWRLGWPVALVCARWHLLCRYDDGKVAHNIEATNNGRGVFHSHPDAYYRQKYGIGEEAVRSGSDLTVLRPRKLLGLFVSLRARHFEDLGCLHEARADYALAASLFPNNLRFRVKAADLTSAFQYGGSLPPGFRSWSRDPFLPT
jgi:hypothetical protein